MNKLKAEIKGIITIPIIVILIIFAVNIYLENKNKQQVPSVKIELSYKDNIANIANKPYLDEIFANYPNLSKEAQQMEFCWRYYDTLDSVSKVWFKSQLK